MLVTLACTRGLDWHTAILRSKKHKDILTESCRPLQFLSTQYLGVLSWNKILKCVTIKPCLHKTMPLNMFLLLCKWTQEIHKLKISASINAQELSWCESACFDSLGRVLISAKGIPMFEQLTWEHRPSQDMFILNPFNSPYNHQSSDRKNTWVFLILSSNLPVREAELQCLGVQLEFKFLLEWDWWSVHLTLVEHTWIPTSIHGSTLEPGLIPSQSQWKSLLWLIA